MSPGIFSQRQQFYKNSKINVEMMWQATSNKEGRNTHVREFKVIPLKLFLYQTFLTFSLHYRESKNFEIQISGKESPFLIGVILLLLYSRHRLY